MADFKKHTRYNNTTIQLDRGGRQFLPLRSALVLEKTNSDTTVTITQDLIRRPDLISEKAYQTPDLWWAILEYNGIADPVFGLIPGLVLKIPEINRLLAAVKVINT